MPVNDSNTEQLRQHNLSFGPVVVHEIFLRLHVPFEHLTQTDLFEISHKILQSLQLHENIDSFLLLSQGPLVLSGIVSINQCC